MHVDGTLFGRDSYVLDILADRDERACFQVIVAPILDKLLDRLAHLGEPLYLVKNDDGFATEKFHPVKTIFHLF